MKGIEQHHALNVAGDTKLQVWTASPSRARILRAILLLCHGFSTDANEHGAFPMIRDRAMAHGMAVVRFDFRAHGLSGGNNKDIRLATMRADVEAVIRHLDERFGSIAPIIPVGLSFGGGAAVHAAAVRPPCLGLVLWYPVIDYEWNFGRSSKLPFTQQMRDSKSARDPHWSEMPVLGTTMHFPVELVSEFRHDTTLSTLSQLRVPVLIYHGARDRMVDPSPVRRLSECKANIELRLVPGAGHGFRLWQPWVAYRTVSWCARIAC